MATVRRFVLRPGQPLISVKPHSLQGVGSLMGQLLRREGITDAEFATVELELSQRCTVAVVEEAILSLPGNWRIVGSSSSSLKSRRFLIANESGGEIIESMFSNACDALAYAASLITTSLRKVVHVPGTRVRVISAKRHDIEDTVIVSRKLAKKLTHEDRNGHKQSGFFSQIRGLLGRRFLKGTCRIAIGEHEERMLKDMGVDVLVCEGSHKGGGDVNGDLILGTINYPRPFTMPGSTMLTLAVVHTVGLWADRGLLKGKSLLKHVQTLGLAAMRKFRGYVEILSDPEKLRKLLMGRLFIDEEEEDADVAARLGDAFRLLDVGCHSSHPGWKNLGFEVGYLHPRQKIILKTWARLLRATLRSYGLEFQGAMIFTHILVDELAKQLGCHVVVSSRFKPGIATVGIRHPVRSAHGVVEFLTIDAEALFGFKIPKGVVFIDKAAALKMDGDFDGDNVGFMSTSVSERPARRALIQLAREARKHEPVPPTGKEEEPVAEIWVGKKKDLQFSPENLAMEMARKAVLGVDSMGLQTVALQQLFLDRAESYPGDEHIMSAVRRGQARLQVTVQGIKKTIYGEGDEIEAALSAMKGRPDWLKAKKLGVSPQSTAYESDGVPIQGYGPMQVLIRVCNSLFEMKRYTMQILPMNTTVWRDFLGQLFLERFNWAIPWNSIHGHSLPQAFDQAFDVWREGTRAIQSDDLLRENTEARLNRYRELRAQVSDLVTPVWECLDTSQRGWLALILWKLQHHGNAHNDGGYLAACGCLNAIIETLQPE